MAPKKSLSYIPTHILVILLVLATLSLLFEAFTFFNISNYESITINGSSYSKSDPGYQVALSEIKNIIVTSISVSAVITGLVGYFTYKRTKQK